MPHRGRVGILVHPCGGVGWGGGVPSTFSSIPMHTCTAEAMFFSGIMDVGILCVQCVYMCVCARMLTYWQDGDCEGVKEGLVMTLSLAPLQREDAGGDKVRERLNMFVTAFTSKQTAGTSEAK